ncbi:MAG TPA: TetR/AcrR family transcriptional regulator [Pseudonocardiaceae bacterium]|nr:TetR/AcrR family transcriptional regulator [Pseudonocardiaceae bacterium]
MSVAGETPQPGERADARRNRQLLLDAAASCIAEQGLSVAALDIAERAGVGVATLYRRFTSKEALIEQVILERFTALEQASARALEDPSPWSGFAAFIHTLAAMVSENSGLSEALGSTLPPAAAAGQQRVRATIQRLTQRAQHTGALRPDISWQDIVFLPKAIPTNPQCLGLRAGERSWERTLTILLDGLRTPSPSPLPGTPPTNG